MNDHCSITPSPNSYIAKISFCQSDHIVISSLCIAMLVMIICLSSCVQFLILGSKHIVNFDNYPVFGAPPFTPDNISGNITEVIESDTVDILTRVDKKSGTERIRLVLVDVPGYLEPDIFGTKNLVTGISLDKNAQVDPDDKQDWDNSMSPILVMVPM